MTTVSTVANNNSTGAATSTTAKSSVGQLDYNAFLKLLIAQLKYQDPTQPTDSTQFVAQLATFSQVEQSISTNSKLDTLLTAQALSLADGVIGRTVTSADGSISGTVQSVTITSAGATATLTNGGSVVLGAGVSIGQAATP
jgi:flagellar basal-body rod modification protein FlgD